MTFDEFQKITFAIKSGVERIERLTALAEKLDAASDFILAEETQRLVGYKGAEEFEQLQAPLENLLSIIDSEISAEKRCVDSHYYELFGKVYSLSTKEG